MILQSLKMAWKSISTNKMRSFLTMLGIIIGVMSLVVLVSLVSGTTDSVTDQISSLGSNMLSVSITDDKNKPLKLDELSTFTEEDALQEIAPLAQGMFNVANQSTEESATIYGTTPAYASIMGIELGSGRFLKMVDVSNNTNVAVISKDIATDIMGRQSVVGENITINGTSFLIIGILEEEESSSFSSSTYEAYIPYSAMVRLSNSVSSNISSFVVSSTDTENMDAAESTLESLLYQRFSNDEDAYSIMNQSMIMEAMESVTSMLAILLGGIAGISLLVGGIGIMNIMLVSVTERTKEIGIRKAIGADRFVIMLQFLIEALMISLMGCAIGIFLSWGTLRIVSIVGSSYDLSFGLSTGVVWIAIIFSMAIGLIFGLYPANKAAKKNPIDALRYTG